MQQEDYQINTAWRRVAAVMYKKPNDSKIVGSVEIDVTDLEAYIFRKRREGLKITLTHVLLLIVARGFKEEVPEFNCFIRRGKPVLLPKVDASVSVLINRDTEMGSVKIPGVDSLTLAELVPVLQEEVTRSKKGDENATMRMKQLLGAIPWPLREWVLDFLKWLTVRWGVSFPQKGITANGLGSFLLTNLGNVGLDVGYPALMPASNVSMVLALGNVNDRPWVVDGQVCVRRILTVSASIDHRVVDGIHIGRLFRYMKRTVLTPEKLESKPAWCEKGES
jgi:pyruvate/2-oxoglutarate dehydrogenase complex dihydrolipoamide acyltransferase (E2) component